MSDSETLTGATGQYAFTGLRAGNYTIEISGFDADDIAFGATSSTAQVAVGESKVVSFEGTYLRASGVAGQVSVEGVGLVGVTVSLQGRGENLTRQTNSAGQFLFDKLRKGDYAVAISGYDDDEYGFETTSKTVTIARGETGSVPFEGIALRTAGVKGTVSVEGHGPLDGVTVSLSGKGEDKAVVTNAAGQWSFDRLHAGDYSVGITGYDADEYGFDVTSENVTVALKETATVEFEGILLRTAAIEGEVTVKGDALPGVTVTVAGGPKDEEHTATTNGAGMYDVDNLHAGDYSVTISGYDTDEYGFEVTTKSVSVGLRETAEVAFDGILLRTAGVSGRVTIDGEARGGLTVTLSGEEDRSGMTTGDGQYAFSGLAAGDYTLTLSGYDTDEYEFDPSSMAIELELDEAAIANFEGRSLRTVVVMGTVSAEGDGIMNVGVTLIKVLGATTGEVLGATITDEDGGYMFDELLAGVYRIDLGETDDEYDFATKSRMGSVATDETAMWNFDADIIRTASVGGMVTVDGDPMGDVMVMLTGDHDTEEEMETDSDGMYMFDGLRKGDYTVMIENPDEDTYDFPTTSRSVSLSVAQKQTDISFAGSMLRRASISGQVYVVDPDMSLEGVMVTLDGDMEDEVMTDANGEYNFPGLAGGDYEIEIENPDADAYIFEVMEVEVEDLGDEEAKIVDFVGEHTTTASISGVLFTDELVTDSMYTEGEPLLPFDSFPLLLQGPGVNDAVPGATDSTGAYSFDGLKAGTYNVVVSLDDRVKAALARKGYAFSGQSLNLGIEVPAATDVPLDFPFRITKQTINAGAILGTDVSASYSLGGVTVTFYPTAEDAADRTNALGSTTTTKPPHPDSIGFGKFEFDRAKDKGPGGGPIDYLVYARASTSHSDLRIHNGSIIEVEYHRAARESYAPALVKLINIRVRYQWWVKSNETAKDGNEFLEGWVATNGSATDGNGRARFTYTLTTAQQNSVIRGTPVRFTASLDDDQADSVDMRERWTQSRSLSYGHTGLEHPDSNNYDSRGHDLGAIYVTWQTHAMVLGVYREADDVEGYTDYQSRLPGGDHRPVRSVEREMKITLMADDDRDRLKPYMYDHDACSNPKNSHKTPDREPVVTLQDGLAMVRCLPRNDEFTIMFDLGDDRVEVGPVERLGGYLEPYNKRDMSISGSTVGTFGDGSGGVPEVRICLSSEGTSHGECATWGYQWETGSVVGKVGGQSGHKVTLAPKTENHGAEPDTTNSRSGGAYRLGGLRDGVYDITAHSTSRYKVKAPLTHEVLVYHDETTDDEDTLTDYVGTAGQDTADWSTQRLGLKIMGYIGNDASPTDKQMRGDEAVEGVRVRLSNGDETNTDKYGFYEFEDLAEGSYTVTPTSTGNYRINRGYSSTTRRFTTTARASADEYPSFDIDGGDHALPYWSYSSRAARHTSVTVSNSSGSVSATLINFVLLYDDGEVAGAVNNISGPSAASIDVLFRSSYSSGVTKISTPSSGQFSMDDLLEGGTYSAEIEDAGWAIPCMTSSSSRATPDDDGPKNSDGSCRYPAPTTISATLRGREDYASMGMLHVYDEDASDDDGARSARVFARTQGTNRANFDSAVSWSAGWSRAGDTEETHNASNLGTISWKSESVRLSFTRARGADYELKVGSTDCSGTTCKLLDWGTGSSREGDERENTLTLMVEAPNGYDDHEYSLMVSRAAPIGLHLANTDVKVLKSDGTDSTVTARGDGAGTSLSTAWTVETKTSSSRSVDVRLDLMTLGDPDEDNAYCAQSVMVHEYNNADTVKALNPPDEDNYEDDICRNTRYRLNVPTEGTIYELRLKSEDGKPETYYLEVKRAGPRLSDDANLRSLAVNPGNMTPAFDSATTEYTVNVTHDIEEVTFMWEVNDSEASSEADPEDADDATEDHQLELGDKGSNTPLTITVTAEDGTEKVYTVTVRRPEEPVTDDATLSNLTIDEGSLDPAFDPDVTEYTVGVPHTVEQVTIQWNEAHEDATSEADPSDADDQTDGHQVDLGDKGEATTLTITVTAADGNTTEEYTVVVTRLFNDDATLADLAVDPGVLDPVFAPADTMYATSVEYDVEEVTVTWELNDTNASATANLGDADDQTDGHQVTLLGEGDTTRFTITVTAENGDTTQAYHLAVARDEGPPSDDASLDELAVTGQTMTPSFRPDRTSYSVNVTHDIDEVSVTFRTTDNNATTDPASSPHTFELGDAGTDTELEILVTAEDETTRETYTIAVSRATAPGFVIKRGGSVVSEFTIDEGDTAIYSVELATEPSDPVTVNVDAGTGITINTGAALSFDDTNWDTPQNVELSSTADDNAAQEDPVEITHTGSSSDNDYNQLADTLDVTLNETDSRGVNLSSTGIEFVENESTIYTVVLNSQPTGDVIVSIGGTRHGVTVNGGSSDLLTFTTGNWETAQDVAVALADNADEENYSAFDLTHRAVGADYDGLPVDDVRVKVMDDDATPSVVISRTEWSMNEETAQTYNIQLTEAPSAGETVTVRLIYNSGDFSVSYAGGGTAAVLTVANFNAGINVTVTAVDVSADVTKTLTHTVTVDDTDDSDDQVYTGSPSASDLRITVKNVPE